MSTDINNRGNSKNDKLISLIVVVNTMPVTIEMNEESPLKALVEKSLNETGNSGREAKDWELKLGDQILDLNKKIKEYNLTDNQELFLSLRAGAGGQIKNSL